VFPGWLQPLLVLTAFIVAELITNGVLEPMLYSSSTGVSSIGVVIATFFWGWLWGPVGLVVAMPMTVALVVLGRHVQSLHAISNSLSDLPSQQDSEDLPPASVVSESK